MKNYNLLLLSVIIIVLFSIPATAETISYNGFVLSSGISGLSSVIDDNYTTVSNLGQTGDLATGSSYIQIDRGSIGYVSNVTIKVEHFQSGGGSSFVNLQYSSDGSAWTTLMTNSTTASDYGMINNSNYRINQTIRYLRSSAWTNNVQSNARWYEIWIDKDIVLNTTMNEGTGTWANDSSGFNNNGSITGATFSSSDNVSGSALSFDGSGDYVNISTSASLNITTGLTMSSWVKIQNLNVPSGIVTKTINGVINTQYEMYYENINGINKFRYMLLKGGGANLITADSTTTNNTWYYVTATHDGTTQRLYINNVLQSETIAVASPTDGGTGVTYLGTLIPGTYEMNGKMDEVKIYNYALNATERATDYQEFQPVPAYPTGGLTIAATYPPQTTTVNFTWHDSEYNADELIVAKDANFNIIVVDQFTANDYYSATLDSGFTYFWKVKQYNSTTGTYGDTSQTETFTVSQTLTTQNNSVQGVVYEIISGQTVPISGASVFITNSTWSSTQITGSNGYYLFTNIANGSYSIVATKKDYLDSKTQQVNMTYNTTVTQDILMERCTSSYTCNYNIQYVRFIVQNWFGDVKYKNVAVAVFKGNDAAASLTGTTGTDGSVTFLLTKDQVYTIVFTNSSQGVSETVTLYPTDTTYIIVVSTASTPWWSNTTYSEVGTVKISVTTGTTNATHGWINISYVDGLAQSSGLVFWINQSNKSGQTLAEITNYSFSTASTGNVSHNFSITTYQGKSFIAAVTGTHQTFGSIYRAFSVHFNGNAMSADDFIPSKMKAMLAIGFSIFVAAIFGYLRASIGAGIFCFLAWFFLLWGWMDYFDTTSMTAGLTLASLASILAIMNDRKKAEGMA